ncbi:hypothetical protein [Streptomyces spectabilis]|uniref:Uncharacterized protein n=1 Tax=Streptomyces spectabilis TaxID=68270 RepID=A0A5P2X2D2_STRST|nr:hypothetical protein [Streptomyces spectabilis]MBB5108327.1 hypothetical protein [Streptomyces spectabilis]MCI3901086.1 hypothetical protein [Streptomyces spectabilis]QEV58581.1 hypothetical protein CP982_07520 [Streptomyces spectabilis]GGV45890.1 hypothetical protein GCM10010245_71890 [Streptomyces spectabilis]
MRYLIWLVMIAPAFAAAITVRDVAAVGVAEPWRATATIATALVVCAVMDYLVDVYFARRADRAQD